MGSKTTLILLAAILALGFGLRAYRVVEPLPVPGDDAHAYYGLAKSLYEEGSYGGSHFENPSDWSPGAPLLYAASFFATGGPREGTARIVELLLGLAAIVTVYLLGRRLNCRPAGLIARLLRSRLPAVHPLDRRPLQRAPGDLHAPRRGARLSLGERTAAIARLAPPRPPLRAHRPDPPGLPAGRHRLRPPRRDPHRPRSRLAARPRGRRPGARRDAVADRPLDDPQPGDPAPHRADLDRRRQGALRRHLPARRRRIPAGQGATGDALPAPHPATPLRGARTGRPDAALQPRRRPLPGACRATRRWARSASRTSPSSSAKTRSATWR